MEKPTKAQPEQFYAENRAMWRNWLEQHHATAPGVWLIYYKQSSSKPRVSYEEAVEEALCFGWIDSRPNAIDEERYMQLFSPRKPNSPWSKINKERIEKLMQQGLMMEAGLKAVEIAKKNGLWSKYDAIEALTIPEDLQAALASNSTAHANFAAFSNSTKKQLLWWIENAKLPATRQKRVAQILSAAEQNKNPLNYAANKKL